MNFPSCLICELLYCVRFKSLDPCVWEMRVSSWDPGRNGSAAVPMREGSVVLSSLSVKVRHSGRVSMILSARTRPGYNVSTS